MKPATRIAGNEAGRPAGSESFLASVSVRLTVTTGFVLGSIFGSFSETEETGLGDATFDPPALAAAILSFTDITPPMGLGSPDILGAPSEAEGLGLGLGIFFSAGGDLGAAAESMAGPGEPLRAALRISLTERRDAMSGVSTVVCRWNGRVSGRDFEIDFLNQSIYTVVFPRSIFRPSMAGGLQRPGGCWSSVELGQYYKPEAQASG